jgi:hypothetical protein
MEKISEAPASEPMNPKHTRHALMLMIGDRVHAIRILEAEIRDLHAALDKLPLPTKAEDAAS